MAKFDDTREILCVGDLIQDGAYRLHSRSRLAFDPVDLAEFRRSLAVLRTLIAELAPERSLAFLIDPSRLSGLSGGPDRRTAEHVGHCVRDILSWDTLRGVRRLGSRGLTPTSGVGFVEGLLIAMNIIERARGRSLAPLRRKVFEQARTRNVVTDALLYAASEGFVSESVNNLISAMSRGSVDDLDRSARRLVAVRGCIGVDAAIGMYMTLRSRLTECPAPGRMTPAGTSRGLRADALSS